ncbi:MAG: helix-turn-helix transcriptional regulator [Actinobacteria bacterium]|nr:helix-turn-helix transcriptional regulator [Actinomycetota bacterium]
MRAAADGTRQEARRLRRAARWDDDGVAIVVLPRRLAERAIVAVGYRPAPEGCWEGPDGESYSGLIDAVCIEVTAAAIESAEGPADPGAAGTTVEALRQIREVAIVPAEPMSAEERDRALSAKLERIGNIAAEGRPDEDWRPEYVAGAGAAAGTDGPMLITRLRFGENVERLRRDRGYSLDTLAARSRIERSEIEEMVRGERKVFADEVLLLAGALGVETDVLFEGIRWTPPKAGGSGFEITGGQDA